MNNKNPMDDDCPLCKKGISVLIVTVMHGDITKDGIKCERCKKKWFDHYLLIDKKPYCVDCGEVILEELMKKEEGFNGV